MSIREIKAFTITCTAAYGNGVDDYVPACSSRDIGPVFAEYKHEVQLPKGWGYRTLHDCGSDHYGYTSHDLFCPACIERLGITVDRP